MSSRNLVIFLGPQPEVMFPDTRQVVKRLGEPIERADADQLIAQGNFIRFVPEPVEWDAAKRPRSRRKKQ